MENTSLVSINGFKGSDTKWGTSGVILPRVKVKIEKTESEEVGEILFCGLSKRIGVLNQSPNEWKDDPKEWIRTGDIGQLVDNKYLKILKRK